MGLDIRLPIGAMFTILGAMLAAFGLVADKAIYERSLGININLGWGLVMLIFGLAMLRSGRRASAKARLAADSAAHENPADAERLKDRAGNARPGH